MRSTDVPVAENAENAENAETEQRQDGVMIDLERLQAHADALYLNRFVDYVKKVRGEHGRYLTLRAGDELAIKAAADGSAESLEQIIANFD